MNIKNINNKNFILDINFLEKKKKCNIYKIINILSKRSNQIEYYLRLKLKIKLKKFNSPNNELKEFFKNKEQIEISKYFENLPKSTIISIFEILMNNISIYKKKKKKV
ncbi:MAG: hypothetical protein NHF93_01065 [Candidatus Shikimatogenerans bostrichidophilus]|nr:MAG: hypothetical protein NHF93_01065 [Candidatus Shikimatogenerans bostrichidophilus]